MSGPLLSQRDLYRIVRRMHDSYLDSGKLDHFWLAGVIVVCQQIVRSDPGFFRRAYVQSADYAVSQPPGPYFGSEIVKYLWDLWQRSTRKDLFSLVDACIYFIQTLDFVGFLERLLPWFRVGETGTVEIVL